ncbi:zinc-dependent metalloprotease [Chitinophaga sancti]|uniref:zinc-dependent metalloprotease n=1 Tax=Chitinophaga sancti TaxID=1004 RepID=UPI002A766258|nr:zinc-dependent metalloprotease [Chitinophaga sancti]WPQ66186.1 zinc-dependent metalloprotease [Chitinophaga sancti]
MLDKRILSLLLLLIAFPLAGRSQGGIIGAAASTPVNEIVPFDKLIPADAKISHGVFNIYQVKEKYYLEISDSLINRQFHLVNRILQASAAVDKIKEGYAGDEIGNTPIVFLKGSDNKIYLSSSFSFDRSRDTTPNGMANVLSRNTISSFDFAFAIRSYGRDNKSFIIDVTDLFSGNSALLVGRLNSSQFQSDKSYIERIRSFPTNLEIQTIKTYGTGKGDSTATLRLNTSILLLPVIPMRERFYDPRVGYFTPFNFDYDKDPQRAAMVLKVNRWRLEPKPEDIDKYMRGELVEPVKPIVFYIDPATPKVWVPYLIQGVNDWQVAFERAGFRNAIIAKEVPADDTAWSMDDARYSVIVYKPSLLANAQGPSVNDYRSGEIIESHVGWYHNVMTLLHSWYMIQAGANDPGARHQQFSNELMGQLIRFVSSHEIGHTLGLKHNFGSSSIIPVDSLRNKKWVEAHGHTPSIMDYARFNYVAQPEDSISEKGIFPRVGDYDKWAIEWGYRLFPQLADARADADMLFKMTTDSLRNNKRLYYGEQALFGLIDSRCQDEDLSEDVMTANDYGIKNLKRVITQLHAWTSMPDDKFGKRSGNGLRREYSAFLSQFAKYQSHVINTIGLGFYDNITATDCVPVFNLIPKAKQQAAVAFLNAQLFAKEPEWLTPDAIIDLVWPPDAGVLTQAMANDVLNELLVPQKLINLDNAEALYGEKTYSLHDFLADMNKGIWNDLSGAQPVSSYHRFLQQNYISSMLTMIKEVKNGAVSATIRGHIQGIEGKIRRILLMVRDEETIYHYNDILLQMDALRHPAS